MKAEEVRRGRMKRHTPKCIRAIERKHPVLGLEQVMKVFDVLVAARLLARVLVHLAVVVDYALLPVAGSRVDARPTEEVLSAREERLIGPQAVPLVQVGDGELHVRVGDHERGQLEGLGTILDNSGRSWTTLGRSWTTRGQQGGRRGVLAVSLVSSSGTHFCK